MTILVLHSFQHQSNSNWRRRVLNYAHFTGSGTASWRLIFTRDDRMRRVSLENKCESSYRSEGYTVGSQGDIYLQQSSECSKASEACQMNVWATHIEIRRQWSTGIDTLSTQPLIELYQEYLLTGKGGRKVRMTTLPPSRLEIWKSQHMEPWGLVKACTGFGLSLPPLIMYREADKSLARPARKQATATEDFDVHLVS